MVLPRRQRNNHNNQHAGGGSNDHHQHHHIHQGLEVSHEQHQQQIIQQHHTIAYNNDDDRDCDDDLLLTSGSSVFLHTIPEGSSDIGGARSSFNPAALAAAAANNNTMMSGGAGDGRCQYNNLNANPNMMQMMPPQSPPSVASSTRAVEAGNPGGPETAPASRSDLGAVLGTASSAAGGMDESSTAVVPDGGKPQKKKGGDSDEGGAKKEGRFGRRHSFTQANKKKVGLVCLLASLMVIGVIVALVFIVKNLGGGGGGSDEEPAHNSAFESTGNTSLTVADTTALDEPTVAPSQEESIMTPAGDILSTLGEMTDDFNEADPSGTDPNESLLVLLDEAIIMLYTSMSMLPSVSSEIYTSTTSPRYKARDWLLNNDSLLQTAIDQAAGDTASASDPVIKLEWIAQRYVMLVFYFATLDPTKTTDNRRHNTLLRRQRNLVDNTAFSIDPELHECFWIPNACGQEDNVDTAYASTQIAIDQVNNDSQIVYLNASHAGLVGTLPFELGYLTNLRELTIHGNDLQGTLPELLPMQLQYLYVLDLSENQFEGPIPTDVWTLPTLRFAYLHGNRFSGTIPDSLPSSPSEDLEEIWLLDNQLSGEIPMWWTQLPSLQVLSVRNNSWTGSLPEVWSEDVTLEFIDFSINQLTGSIPDSLMYSIPSLKFLYLDNNTLTGTLPYIGGDEDELDFTVTVSVERDTNSNLQMEALWLQNNQLTGTVPRGFGWKWSRLRQLELQGNQLTGLWECADDGSKVWPQLEEMSIDCFDGPNLMDVTAVSFANPSESSGSSSGGGVDMGSCNACCIKCF